jgi:hypothetical protein
MLEINNRPSSQVTGDVDTVREEGERGARELTGWRTHDINIK